MLSPRRTCVVLPLLWGCGGSAGPHALQTPRSGDDTAVALGPEGCPVVDGLVLRLHPTGVPTVLDVVVDSPEALVGQMVVEEEDGTRRSVETVSSDGLHHTGMLLGLRSNRSYGVWFEGADAAGAARCSAVQSLTTGTYASELPPVMPLLLEEGRSEGFHLLPMMTERSSLLTVLDADAQLVWGHVLSSLSADDLLDDAADDDDEEDEFPEGIAFRAHLDPSGRGILVNSQGQRSTDDGRVHLVTWGGALSTVATIPSGHTDFVPLEDGSIAMLGWQVKEFDGRRILGDTLLLWHPDGTVDRLWSTFTSFGPDLSRSYTQDFVHDEPPVEDWSHANGLSYDPVDDAFLVTVSEPSAVVKLDRSTGAVHWVLATGSLDFDGVAPGTVDLPHSAQAVDGGLVVFNRTRPEERNRCSHMADLAVDPAGRTAWEVAHWEGSDCRKNMFLGSAQRLDGGHSVVTWSSYGLLEEVDEEGQSVLQAALALGAGMGFGTFVSELPGALR